MIGSVFWKIGWLNIDVRNRKRMVTFRKAHVRSFSLSVQLFTLFSANFNSTCFWINKTIIQMLLSPAINFNILLIRFWLLVVLTKSSWKENARWAIIFYLIQKSIYQRVYNFNKVQENKTNSVKVNTSVCTCHLRESLRNLQKKKRCFLSDAKYLTMFGEL